MTRKLFSNIDVLRVIAIDDLLRVTEVEKVKVRLNSQDSMYQFYQDEFTVVEEIANISFQKYLRKLIEK